MATTRKRPKKAAKKVAKTASKKTASKPKHTTITRTTKTTEQRTTNPDATDEQSEVEMLRALVEDQRAEIERLQADADHAVRLAQARSARRARIGRAAKRAGFRTAEDWQAWCEERGRNPEVLSPEDEDRIKRAAEIRAASLSNP